MLTMVNYEVAVLLNEGEGRFWNYEPAHDRLVLGPTFRVEAPNIDAALGRAWEIGNKTDRTYPRDVRSVSVGDVLFVADANTHVGAFFAVAGVGFDDVRPESVAASLISGRAKRERLA